MDGGLCAVGREKIVKHPPNKRKIDMLATLAKLRPRRFVSMLKSSIVRSLSFGVDARLTIKITSSEWERLKFAMRNIYINDFRNLVDGVDDDRPFNDE